MPHRPQLAALTVALSLLGAGALVLTAPAGAATTTLVSRPGPSVALRRGDHDADTGLGQPSRPALRAAATPLSTWTVSYPATSQGASCTTATSAEKAVFTAATAIWAQQVASTTVPITVEVCFQDLGDPGILGSAGPDLVGSSGSPVFRPKALVNSTASTDVDPTRPDVYASFNTGATGLYLGTDGMPGRGQVDFESVVLHELGHGLGFLGLMTVSGGKGFWDDPAKTDAQAVYLPYDQHTVGPDGKALLSYARGSTALGSALTTTVTWNGAHGVAAAGGSQPVLYTPSTFQDGSTYGHLDEATYPAGDADALMTPVLQTREVIRSPGPIMLGMLQDEGWTTASSAPTPTPTATTTSPAPTPSSTTAPPSPSPTPTTTAPAVSGDRFTAVTPVRVLDTRYGIGARKGRVTARTSVDVTMTGSEAGVPDDATAVVLNVTGVLASGTTNVRVYPTGSGGPPTVSNLNLVRGQTRADLVTVKVGDGGQVSLFNAGGTVDLLADVEGWYAPDASSAYHPVTPRRLLDTRSAGPALGKGGARDVQVTGGEVPASATSVVLGLTAASATTTTYLQAYPTPSGEDSSPTFSDLNTTATSGATPNLAVVPVGSGGSVRVRNLAGSTQVLVDLYGWYDPSSSGGQLFHALDPVRALDTRTAPPALGARATRDVPLAGDTVPSSASAVVLTVTGVAASATTNVRVYPAAGTTVPTVSSLNLLPGTTSADAVVVGLAGGAVRLFNSAGTLDALVDVAGWFGPAG